MTQIVRQVQIKPTYSHEYKVIIGVNIINKICDFLEQTVSTIDKVVLFVQESVANLDLTQTLEQRLREKWLVHRLITPPGEQVKSIDYVLESIEFLHNVQATRSTLIIGVGGGALGDFVGFVASIYMRGLPLVLVPTTLLSMVDSAIGGKNAVNMFHIKNVVGTIYQPKLVVEELLYLNYLPEREIRSGMAEIIKYGVTIDPELLSKVEKCRDSIMSRDWSTIADIVERSVKCKAWIVHLDEREERDVRQILNYGHTVGHAVEACAYGRLTHGECVMIGMCVESTLGVNLGYTESTVPQTLEKLADLYSLPKRIPRSIEKSQVLKKIEFDKKRFGSAIKLPVVRRPGEFEIVKLDLQKLLAELDKMLDSFYE